MTYCGHFQLLPATYRDDERALSTCTELFEIKFRKILDILTIGLMTGKGSLLELFEVLKVLKMTKICLHSLPNAFARILCANRSTDRRYKKE